MRGALRGGTAGNGAEIERGLERVFAIVARLDERKAQKADTLSVGEQQMLAARRAFTSCRGMMLLDDSSMGLAPLLMMKVFHVLKEINLRMRSFVS